jgi:hypothetical protein
MKSNPEDEELLRSHLLGKLPDPEAELLEQRLIEDDDLFKQGEALETDLLAAADRGELAPEERGRVLRRLASSRQGRERFAFARSLNAAADHYFAAAWRRIILAFLRPAGARKAAFWPAVAAAAAALIVAISLLVVPRAPVEATFMLSLANLRSAEEVQKIQVQADADFVVLQLDIEGWEDAGSFHAAVRKKSAGTVWQSDLQPQRLSWGPALVLRIPAERLTAGRYEVTVKAGSEDMTQDFVVVRGSRG